MADGGERLREEDLLIEVLSRLDVKTLLQCKSVSKAWYSLISSPVFIKSHLNHGLTSTSSDNKTTLVVRLIKNANPRDSPEEDGSYSLFQLGGCDDYVAHLDYPFSKGDYPFTPASLLIGCVCGIVCVCVDPNTDINVYRVQATLKDQTDIYIWNPATKQSKLIPAYSLHDVRESAVLGFGFDPIDFDFKVVRVVSRDIFPEVYSVNRNVWRKIEAKLSDIPNSNNIFEICIHGFLVTIGLNGMMAFDLNKEVFVCDIKLPVLSNNAWIADLSNNAWIADFKDSIAVIIFDSVETNGRIKLWTLDDEVCLRGTGVKPSWTMMLTINVDVRVDWFYGIFNSVELLLDGDDWFLYNLDKKVGRCLHTSPLFDFDKVFRYTESLLPVAGSKLVNWSDDEDDNAESNSDSEEVSEESSVDLEDDDERSSVGVGSEDDNEESTVGSEDDEECSGDSEDDNKEISTDSGDE